MNASNTAADRAANPMDFHQLSPPDGTVIVQIRNDLPRDEAIRIVRAIADRLELQQERELTGTDLRKVSSP